MSSQCIIDLGIMGFKSKNELSHLSRNRYKHDKTSSFNQLLNRQLNKNGRKEFSNKASKKTNTNYQNKEQKLDVEKSHKYNDVEDQNIEKKNVGLHNEANDFDISSVESDEVKRVDNNDMEIINLEILLEDITRLVDQILLSENGKMDYELNLTSDIQIDTLKNLFNELNTLIKGLNSIQYFETNDASMLNLINSINMKIEDINNLEINNLEINKEILKELLDIGNSILGHKKEILNFANHSHQSINEFDMVNNFEIEKNNEIEAKVLNDQSQNDEVNKITENKLDKFEQLDQLNTIEQNNIKSENESTQIYLDMNQLNDASNGSNESSNTNITKEKFFVSDLNKTDIFNQIVEKAKMSITDKQSEIRIKLKPDILGEMLLKISVEKGAITAKAIVDNYQVKQLIESNLSQLEDSLNEQGLNFQTIDVSVGKDSSFDQRNFFMWNNKTKRSDKKIIENDEQVEEVYLENMINLTNVNSTYTTSFDIKA